MIALSLASPARARKRFPFRHHGVQNEIGAYVHRYINDQAQVRFQDRDSAARTLAFSEESAIQVGCNVMSFSARWRTRFDQACCGHQELQAHLMALLSTGVSF